MQWKAIFLVAVLGILGASLFSPGVAMGDPLMVSTHLNYSCYPLRKFPTCLRPQGNPMRPIDWLALSFSAGAIGMTFTLGMLIKQLRQKKHLSQRQLAKACKVSSTYLSLIESGGRLPPEELCVKLAAVLDYDARELAGRSRMIKSAEAAEMLYGSGGGGHDTDDSRGNGGDYDPDLEAIRRRLKNLKNLMSEPGYSKLVWTLLELLAAYEEGQQGVETNKGVDKGQISSTQDQPTALSSIETSGGKEKGSGRREKPRRMT